MKRWNSVRFTDPPTDMPVLIYSSDGTIEVAIPFKDDVKTKYGQAPFNQYAVVTHWMSLPARPGEVSEDDYKEIESAAIRELTKTGGGGTMIDKKNKTEGRVHVLSQEEAELIRLHYAKTLPVEYATSRRASDMRRLRQNVEEMAG